MSTYPHEYEHENEYKVRGKDDREIDCSVPGHGVEDIRGVQDGVLRSLCSRPYENDHKSPEICGRPVESTEVSTRAKTSRTERKRERSVND